MNTIAHRRQLTGVEADGLADYLRRDGEESQGHGRILSERITSGAVVHRGTVFGAEKIGGLETCLKKQGADRMALVSELREDFEAADDRLNKENLMKIDRYRALIETNRLKENFATAIEDNGKIIIFDGNKRSVAHFEIAQLESEHAMPIYLIQTP